MEYKQSQKRMIHYDLLRILAAFSVVMLHTSAQFWYVIPVDESRWLISNTYNSLFRFGVPIFVMISGALFLEHTPQIDTRRLYVHNILRLISVYIVWSCIYGLIDCARYDISLLSGADILREMLYGKYHLWFLPMLISLYVILPILKIWVSNADRKNIQYFLALFLILQICGETVKTLILRDDVLYITSLLQESKMICSYLGYFILGYYIAHYGIERRLRRCFYLAALPSALCNIFLSTRLSLWKGEPLATVNDSFGIFTFIAVTAIFLFFRDVAERRAFRNGSAKIIEELSRNTLGVYVMHLALLERLDPDKLLDAALPDIIYIPLLAVICYALCSVAAGILRRIPLIGKYIC